MAPWNHSGKSRYGGPTMSRKALRILMAVVLLAAGYGIGRVAQAAVDSKNYDRDAAEMDRTQEALIARVRGINDKLKTIAKGVTADKLDDPNKEREKEIGKTLDPFFQDAQVLFIQTFLLAIDNAVDTGGAPAEGAILGGLSKQLDVPINEFTDREEKTKLGLGGVALGYAIAKAAKVPADEIFANKADNRSWPELMHFRQVSLQQVQTALSGNSQQ